MKNSLFFSLPCMHNIETSEDVLTALEFLEEKEAEIDVDGMKCPVSVASFLCGFCGNLAEYLHKKYGYGIGILYSEEDPGIRVVEHAYNFVKVNGTKYYIDSRGVTDDYNMFVSLFMPRTVKLSRQIFRKEFRRLKAAKKYVDWHFTRDNISDGMIKWLMYEYGENYEVTVTKKNPRGGENYDNENHMGHHCMDCIRSFC